MPMGKRSTTDQVPRFLASCRSHPSARRRCVSSTKEGVVVSGDYNARSGSDLHPSKCSVRCFHQRGDFALPVSLDGYPDHRTGNSPLVAAQPERGVSSLLFAYAFGKRAEGIGELTAFTEETRLSSRCGGSSPSYRRRA